MNQPRGARVVWIRIGCLALLAAFHASAALSQSVLDRVIGPFRDQPLTIVVRANWGVVSQLAEAAGVPMGFETAAPEPGAVPSSQKMLATGRRLRDVLDVLISADPHYEWREDAGVVVVRPVEAWANASGLLDSPVGPITLENATSDDAGFVLGKIFGVDGKDRPDRHFKRFSLDIPAETPLLQALNAVVRAHGTLCWALERTLLPRVPQWPLLQSFFLTGDPASVGLTIPLNATIHPGPYVVRRSPPDATATPIPILDRIVDPSDGPIRISMFEMTAVYRLSKATGVPMGVQISGRHGDLAREPFREAVDVSGMILRDALALIKSSDPRFDWRETNGLIVFRPVESWSDPEDPLARPTSAVSLKDVPIGIVLQHVLAAFGRAGQPLMLADRRRVSIELPAATLFDLLNAAAQSYGKLGWGWGDMDQEFRGEVPNSVRHQINFYSLDSTAGGQIPVP
jgi:hypothetical protein